MNLSYFCWFNSLKFVLLQKALELAFEHSEFNGLYLKLFNESSNLSCPINLVKVGIYLACDYLFNMAMDEVLGKDNECFIYYFSWKVEYAGVGMYY